MRTENYGWQQNRQGEVIPQKPSRSSQSDDDDAYLRLLRIKEAAESKNAEKPAVPTPVKQTEPAPRKSTEAESDRRTAIWLALNAIKRFVKSPFWTEFSPLDREDILPEGIVAKAIDMGENAGSSFDEDSLKKMQWNCLISLNVVPSVRVRQPKLCLTSLLTLPCRKRSRPLEAVRAIMTCRRRKMKNGIGGRRTGLSDNRIIEDEKDKLNLCLKIIETCFPLAIVRCREATVRLGDGRKAPESRRSRIPSCKLLTN